MYLIVNTLINNISYKDNIVILKCINYIMLLFIFWNV